MGNNEHECLKEDKFREIDQRQDRLESDVKHEARKHEDLRKTINGKLDKIWDKMQDGDNQIRSQLTTNIITLCIGFVSAIIGALGVLLWLR